VDAVSWLLDSDPAIRYQAMRDLVGAPEATLASERSRIVREGLGAALLAAQGPDGAWRGEGRPDWLLTLFAMQLLRATGVDPTEPAVEAAMTRLAAGFRWHESLGGRAFFEGETEPCINGNALASSAYFGRPREALALRLVSEQLEDGGWNCEAPKSARSSFHSTICVLEGLLEYERARGATPVTTAARSRAEAYLLDRRLFRRRSSGEVASAEFLEFAFPPRYGYDVLRALDYFRDAGGKPDARMREALNHLVSRRRPDRRWILDRTHNEALPFTFPETAGEPSRWNTLRSLRVLRWWEANGPDTAAAP
jgi:hypothetical protein